MNDVCYLCGKTEQFDWDGLVVSACWECDRPLCSDCVACDCDSAGDPLSYVITQWTCPTNCERRVNDPANDSTSGEMRLADRRYSNRGKELSNA